MLSKTASLALLTSGALALEIPSNVQEFYNSLKSKGECSNKLATGFYNSKFEDGGKI